MSLTIVGEIRGCRENYYITQAECICECGKRFITSMRQVRLGRTKSCGCIRAIKHGMYKRPEYQIWQAIRSRCGKQPGYENIYVCDRWHMFENFYADMGPKPSATHTIERIDVYGNYEPSNCRWATRYEQARNTTRNRWIEFRGQKMCLKDFVKLCGKPSNTIRHRLLMMKQTPEQIYEELK